MIAKIEATGSAQKRYGGGRPRTVHTMENFDAVETLVLSQEDRPGTHRTIRQVSRETSISRTSVYRRAGAEMFKKETSPRPNRCA